MNRDPRNRRRRAALRRALDLGCDLSGQGMEHAFGRGQALVNRDPRNPEETIIEVRRSQAEDPYA